MQSKIFTLIALVSFYVSVAQKQFNNWVFGEAAAVSWNSGSPVSFSGTALATTEGVATMSDASGQLLFYTDGVTVYDRNNTAMPNGTGLLGNYSTTQSAIIVPKPDSANIYYIFTADVSGGVNGINYSELDMTLNGGLGDINTIKNVQLYAPSTEKLAFVRHANGTDYWVVSHQRQNNTFVSYQVSSAGVNPVAVTTNIGSVENDDIGYLRFSHDGKKMFAGLDLVKRGDFFDFDNSTGIPSNVFTDSTYIKFGPYGSEFSPDDRYLYVAEESNDTTPLWQYDMQAGSPAQILASRTLVGSHYGADYYAALQLATDNKIYIACYGHAYLDCISSPNSAGAACNLIDDAVPLSGTAMLGLPLGLVNGNAFFTFLYTCLGDSTMFIPGQSSDSVSWNFGDPGSGLANTSGLTSPNHLFSDTGTFTVTLISFSGGLSDTAINQVIINSSPVVNLGNDTSICGANSLVLNAGPSGTSYLWQDGSTGQTDTASQTGTYVVTVGLAGCSTTDSVHIIFGSLTPPVITLSDSVICANDSAQICAPAGYATYTWNTGQSTNCFYTQLAGNYYVSVSDNNNCSAESNHIALSVFPSQPASLSVNGDTMVVYNAANVQWYLNDSAIAGANSPVYIATIPGQYTVQITDTNGCIEISNPVSILGIERLNQSIGIEVYPNPFNDVTNIFITGLQGEYGFELYDVAGRMLRDIPALETNHFQLRRDGLVAGVYVYRIVMPNKQAAYGKLVVE